MSGLELPLGLREGSALEFKQAEILENPEKVAYEAAALLNGGGGELWIGIREDNGFAVEAIPVAENNAAAERAKDRLLDALIDQLSPNPTGEELRIEVVPTESGPLLRLRLWPVEPRKPYARRTGTRKWEFPLRIDARVRPMTREEIFPADRGRADSELVEARSRVLDARERTMNSSFAGLWMRLEPLRSLNLDLRDPFLEELAGDPLVSGNSRVGNHFARTDHRVRIEKERRSWGQPGGADSRVRTEVRRSGALSFEMGWGRFSREGKIWPLPLFEAVVSAFRIAGALWSRHDEEQGQAISDLALLGIDGRQLYWDPPWDAQPLAEEVTSLIWGHNTPPVDIAEVVEYPDRQGFRWLRRIYEAFGLGETALPSEYDCEAERLALPT